MNFSDWNTAMGTLLEIQMPNPATASPSSDPNYNSIYPRAIEFAELTIQRDLDLINTQVTDDSATLTANSRKFTLPTDKGVYIVVDQVAIFVGGARQPPLIPTSRDFLDFSYPGDASLTPAPSYPIYWCPVDGTTILVGPAPDTGYTVEVVGTQRFVMLSSTNTSNFLTLQLEDLYIAASMIWFSGYQRDFGSQSDNPQMAVSWQTVYNNLKTPAFVEESRKKFRSQGWRSRQPNPISLPAQN